MVVSPWYLRGPRRCKAGWQSSARPAQPDGLSVQLLRSGSPLPSDRCGTGSPLPSHRRGTGLPACLPAHLPAGAGRGLRAASLRAPITQRLRLPLRQHGHSRAAVLGRSSAMEEPGAKWEI